MSSLPSQMEAKMLQQALKKAALVEANKKAAAQHLLKIQLMLAQRTK